MAYSRWSKDSVWYCFWSAMGPSNNFKLPTKKLKNEQVFEICDFPGAFITYGELKKDFKSVVKDIEKFYSQEHVEEREKDVVVWPAKNLTFEQMVELRRYLLEFIYDVDEHFKWNNFFLYEWYYPIRNKIIWKYRDLIRK